MSEQKTAKILDLLDKMARQLDAMHAKFYYESDAETLALKVSPEPAEVLAAMDQGIKEEVAGVKVKTEEIGSEVHSVKETVGEVNDKVDHVQTNVTEIQDSLK